MGKSYKKNSQHYPKSRGKVFVKDQSWKKQKHNRPDINPVPIIDPADIPELNRDQ